MWKSPILVSHFDLMHISTVLWKVGTLYVIYFCNINCSPAVSLVWGMYTVNEYRMKQKVIFYIHPILWCEMIAEISKAFEKWSVKCKKDRIVASYPQQNLSYILNLSFLCSVLRYNAFFIFKILFVLVWSYWDLRCFYFHMFCYLIYWWSILRWSIWNNLNFYFTGRG